MLVAPIFKSGVIPKNFQQSNALFFNYSNILYKNLKSLTFLYHFTHFSIMKYHIARISEFHLAYSQLFLLILKRNFILVYEIVLNDFTTE